MSQHQTIPTESIETDEHKPAETPEGTEVEIDLSELDAASPLETIQVRPTMDATLTVALAFLAIFGTVLITSVLFASSDDARVKAVDGVFRAFAPSLGTVAAYFFMDSASKKKVPP